MNPEQQRIAIAEACGWKNADHPDVMQLKQGWTMPEKWCMDPKGVLRFDHDRPNCLNDLNAMHDAEKVLDPKGKDGSYEYWLRTVCHIPERESAKGRYFYRATAAQRAEAFLRTIGKWEEAK